MLWSIILSPIISLHGLNDPIKVDKDQAHSLDQKFVKPFALDSIIKTFDVGS